MNVLVTGSAGFVGRHLVEALEDRGDTVNRCDPKHGDFRGNSDCRAFFHSYAAEGFTLPRYDLVFHCAAEVGGREGIDRNAAHLGAVNLQLDGALWEWALRTRPGRVVYFSSAAAYPTWLQSRAHWQVAQDMWRRYIAGERFGDAVREPELVMRLAEREAGRHETGVPDESYGWAKLVGEVIADRVRKAGVPVTIVRPFSMYGSDQNETEYPFPAFARRAARHDDPFVVWGDGTQVRDWLHIDDAVEAIFALIEAKVDGPVNLCTGRGMSMDELAQLAMDAADYDASIEHLTGKPTGVHHRVGDPSLLHRFYMPTISVEDGMRRAVAQSYARV